MPIIMEMCVYGWLLYRKRFTLNLATEFPSHVHLKIKRDSQLDNRRNFPIVLSHLFLSFHLLKMQIKDLSCCSSFLIDLSDDDDADKFVGVSSQNVFLGKDDQIVSAPWCQFKSPLYLLPYKKIRSRRCFHCCNHPSLKLIFLTIFYLDLISSCAHRGKQILVIFHFSENIKCKK